MIIRGKTKEQTSNNSVKNSKLICFTKWTSAKAGQIIAEVYRLIFIKMWTIEALKRSKQPFLYNTWRLETSELFSSREDRSIYLRL
jgi:hypothetical protein